MSFFYSICVIIPARLESKRLNRKLLMPGPDGRPILYHTWKKATESTAWKTFITTDSEEIRTIAEGFGAEVIMTSPYHKCGTDRVFEAYEKYNIQTDIIVNLQADEPQIRGEDIDRLASEFSYSLDIGGEPFDMGTLAVPLNADESDQPENVKVVLNPNSSAIYFSRQPIPGYKHIGIYAFYPDMLRSFANLKQSRLEQDEKLEQLRAIENGYKIHVTILKPPDDADGSWPIGINTRDNYNLWMELCQK